MIKKLRRKFIAAAMISIAAVFFLIVCGINIANYYTINRSADNLLSIIADNQGTFPAEPRGHNNDFPAGKHPHLNDKLPAEAAYNTRYFTVTLCEDGTVYTINTGKIHAISPSDAKDYATSLYQAGKTKGFIGNYKYLQVKNTAVSENDADSGTFYMYIFLDCEQDLTSFRHLLAASLLISLAGLLVVFILVLALSGKALKPAAESYAKQKRFITDASHELKTPLTIIDANTEILEMTGEENEWTKSIHNQVRRLTELTEKMVFLSRLDEENVRLNMAEFSLSDAVTETVEPFLAVAQTSNRTLTLHIEPDVAFRGDEANIRQLIIILVDNALKYSSEPGEIRVELYSSGRSRHLVVWNTVEEIEPGSHDVLFDRFYRRDSSRNSSTGGYGIGLSAAQAIVLAHKGKISARSADGKSICFSVTL